MCDTLNDEEVSNDSENEEALEAVVQILENQIVENIFSYQSHVNLINTLQKLTDLDRLRVARERMAKQFPLTTELWLDWLEDELRIANSTEEKENVLKLFKRAVKDYLSIKIWLKYLEFAEDYYGNENPSSISEVRAIYECALTAGGLHVTEGALLWYSYIEYENSVLSKIKNSYDELVRQLNIVATLYKRLLSCPLMNIEDSFHKFSSWIDNQLEHQHILNVDKKLVESIYKKSREKLLKIKVYEDAIISDSNNAKYHYKEYLEYEKSKDGSPIRVQFLYERMISEFCLFEDVWLDYISFVSNVLNNGRAAIELVERSLRNCPWSLSLYQRFIYSLEKFHYTHAEVTGAFERGVASGLQTAEDFKDLWMSYLEYLRRRFDEPSISKDEEEKRLEELRANFVKASEFLLQLEGSDPNCFVLQYWARIEAIYCKNMEKTRSLWNVILNDDNNKTSDMWLEYINIERAYGDSKHLRKLFSRALQNTNDCPEKIALSWLNYERDEGTLESFEVCLEKTKLKLSQVKELRQYEEVALVTETDEIKYTSGRKRPRVDVEYKKENSQMEINSDANNLKRKHTVDVPPVTVTPSKKPKREAPEDVVKNLIEENQKGHGVTVTHDSSKDNRTVFLSNLDFSVNESTISEVFSGVGAIADLRLVKDYKGRSKGYCYVEFERSCHAADALKKDRQLINGRPMYVSKCDPDKETREKGFKYSSSLEKNKLFVRGLPYNVTESDLRDLFSKYGALKDVRVVTYRNGHSKGLAYVDYEDEVSAAQAIIQTDGMIIGERQISVAISNPPDRKTNPIGKTVFSLGGGSKESGPHGRRRTQISFVPRALQLNPPSTPVPSVANLSITSPQASIEQNLK